MSQPQVRWLGESPPIRWLGAPPQACLDNFVFKVCYDASKAQAEADCQFAAGAGFQNGLDCINYYTELYAYQKCKQYCPNLQMPIKPAPFNPPGGATSNQPGGGRATPAVTSTPKGESSSGNTVLIIAAAAVVGVALFVALT